MKYSDHGHSPEKNSPSGYAGGFNAPTLEPSVARPTDTVYFVDPAIATQLSILRWMIVTKVGTKAGIIDHNAIKRMDSVSCSGRDERLCREMSDGVRPGFVHCSVLGDGVKLTTNFRCRGVSTARGS